ncbi:MAG: indolepyruvate ferredoxin oxidoreductase subunit alpha [Nitrospirae bacterium]|nr:indolepyruvate ferredoxin oxidoreductase subunit alpha [Nitrospirota bacterium]MCL5422070.1 indolepyruvate ferredoxin oxidoreductase subunit alpha [Nitrospirota bacterium]
MKARAAVEKKVLLSGNEAIARGAYEAGVKVASAYPGTPSTEILENLCTYEGVYTEWAPNEKVALEVALGASFAGVRSLAAMKHVGLNVAADPLFTAAYTGVRGGLVIVTADDPEMHSSQNEQDNRNYAFAAKVPMLEPADAAEAKEFLKIAYRISEEFDTPVLLRTTTRVAHVKGIVTTGSVETSSVKPGIEKMPEKFVMLPSNARKRRVELEKRMARLREFAETFPENRMGWGDRGKGFITSSVSYLYVKEAFPEASLLKLGMVYPFPEKMIRDFASKVEELYIVEELDPFIELHVKAMGIRCKGKDVIPSMGELNSHIVRKAITGEATKPQFELVPIPLRPPNLCPGCPHRGIFYGLSKLGVFIAGDIGCYTLAALKPLSAMDSCICMGASIGTAFGMEKALGKDSLGKIVAVIGDSTFIHSGITGLIDIVYNKGFSTVIILDNRTTGMTGHQPNPSTGVTITGDTGTGIDIEALCRAIGIRHVYTVNPNDIEATQKIVKQEIERSEPSVIITKAPCVLLPEMKKRKDKKLYIVIPEKCTGCRTCLKLGCPAIEWAPLTPEEAKKLGYKETQKGYSRINAALCDGCGQCAPLCKFKAIIVAGEDNG